MRVDWFRVWFCSLYPRYFFLLAQALASVAPLPRRRWKSQCSHCDEAASIFVVYSVVGAGSIMAPMNGGTDPKMLKKRKSNPHENSLCK